jgi:PAS domain S-box-containing protein
MTLQPASTTILLIDDEPSGLKTRERMLESAGFGVLAAASAAEGMRLFRAHEVDAVVTGHLAGQRTASLIASTMKRLRPAVPIVSFADSADAKTPRNANLRIGEEEGPRALIAALDQLVAQKKRKLTLARPPRPRCTALPKQALLATIVEDSTDAILSKTLDGIITSWNHAAELMYGYAKEEAIGSPVAMLLPKDRPNEAAQLLRLLAKGERVCNFETVRVAKDGTRLDVSLTISPIRDDRKRIVGASAIERDINEKKRAEEALRKAERLAVVGRMAATLAHEINNPLEAVSNLLFLLKNSMELSQDARKFVELANEELERVTQITQLTLGMQRGSSKAAVAFLTTHLIENVLTLYAGKARELGIKVVRRYSDEGKLSGFPVELQQVFSNLIVNAIDAMASAGDTLMLGVRCARHPVTGKLGVRISILDNGPGIAPEHTRHLFEPFYTTKGEHGTGIGLWVSRTIVEKYGGTLRLHSSMRLGRSGTCFSIFLPLCNVAVMPSAA